MSDDRPTLTLTEAAKATGVSRKTLRRRLDAHEFPNASRLDGPAGDSSGPWVIPIADLLGAGFTLHSSDDVQVEDKPDDHSVDLRIHDLEHELALERERRRAADDLRAAAERNAEDLRTALRMLEAGPQPAWGPAPDSPTSQRPTLTSPGATYSDVIRAGVRRLRAKLRGL